MCRLNASVVVVVAVAVVVVVVVIVVVVVVVINKLLSTDVFKHSIGFMTCPSPEVSTCPIQRYTTGSMHSLGYILLELYSLYGLLYQS